MEFRNLYLALVKFPERNYHSPMRVDFPVLIEQIEQAGTGLYTIGPTIGKARHYAWRVKTGAIRSVSYNDAQALIALFNDVVGGEIPEIAESA